MSRSPYPPMHGSVPPPTYYAQPAYQPSAGRPPVYGHSQAPSYAPQYLTTNGVVAPPPSFAATSLAPPRYNQQQRPSAMPIYPNSYSDMPQCYQQSPPTYVDHKSLAPSVSVNVVPFVVPALTPAPSSAMATIKPSHQVLIVKPLPAFLTEDEDLLTLAKRFVVSSELADQEAAEVQRILQDGDEAVLARIRALKNKNVCINGAAQKKTTDDGRPQSHCNYLPFAAKVIRKSVLSAVTAALQKQQQSVKNATALSATDIEHAVQTAVDEASTVGCDVIPNSQCFCEEGYGFLLFATEEAGLTFLRAAQKSTQEEQSHSAARQPERFGLRPRNVSAVRCDFDEIDQIKMRLYENNDEATDALNASFSSSLSSSSCDSATSFDSQSSFESLASDVDEDNDDQIDKKKAGDEANIIAQNFNSVLADCDACTTNRRMYRTYYRAKINKRIDAVKIRCRVIVDAKGQQNISSDNDRRPATFNGVPLPSKEHVAEMRSLFANCFFNTVLSAAGADGTVSAKAKPKALRINGGAASSSSAVQLETPSASFPAPVSHKVVIHRPVLINCTDATSPVISFMRAKSSTQPDNQPTSTVMSVVSEDLSKFATAIAASDKAQGDANAAEKNSHRHHTHHRHCVEHRMAASVKRIEVRRNKAIQTKAKSRTVQNPHVVNIARPALVGSTPFNQMPTPPAYVQPATVPATTTACPNVEPLLQVDDTVEYIAHGPVSTCASMSVYPTHSATNSISFVDASEGSVVFASCSPTPVPTIMPASPSVSTVGSRRYRHNPYGNIPVQTTSSLPSPIPPVEQVSEIVADSAVKEMPNNQQIAEEVPKILVSREPQSNHNTMVPQQQGGGLAAYLPAWAQNGGTGLQGAANNASAKLRNMLSMSKVKRF